MLQSIPVTEVRKNIAEIINRVQYNDETIIIEKQGKPVAQISGIAERKHKKKVKLPPVFSMGGGYSTYRREEIYD